MPTDAAQVLAEVAGEVLKTMTDGIRSTREAAGYGAGQLKIGSLYSLTIRTVPEVVIALKERRPELQAEPYSARTPTCSTSCGKARSTRR